MWRVFSEVWLPILLASLVSRHHYGSKLSISSTRWWSCHKKRDLSVFARPETNEVRHEVLPRYDLSPFSFRCLIFPTRHPLILLQQRYAFIKRKRPKSFLAAKLGVGMPGLIWLNTLVLECAGLLVCVPLHTHSLSCCCSRHLSSVV